MTLVQIDLRRGRVHGPQDTPGTADEAEGDHASALVASPSPVPADSLAPATAGLAFAGGLVLLAPLAVAAGHSFPALVVLLAGLVTLGLLAALLLPALARAPGDDPP